MCAFSPQTNKTFTRPQLLFFNNNHNCIHSTEITEINDIHLLLSVPPLQRSCLCLLHTSPSCSFWSSWASSSALEHASLFPCLWISHLYKQGHSITSCIFQHHNTTFVSIFTVFHATYHFLSLLVYRVTVLTFFLHPSLPSSTQPNVLHTYTMFANIAMSCH